MAQVFGKIAKAGVLPQNRKSCRTSVEITRVTDPDRHWMRNPHPIWRTRWAGPWWVCPARTENRGRAPEWLSASYRSRPKRNVPESGGTAPFSLRADAAKVKKPVIHFHHEAKARREAFFQGLGSRFDGKFNLSGSSQACLRLRRAARGRGVPSTTSSGPLPVTKGRNRPKRLWGSTIRSTSPWAAASHTCSDRWLGSRHRSLPPGSVGATPTPSKGAQAGRDQGRQPPGPVGGLGGATARPRASG